MTTEQEWRKKVEAQRSVAKLDPESSFVTDDWRKKVEGRAICARCGWRRADHGFGARLLGAVSCKKFEVGR